MESIGAKKVYDDERTIFALDTKERKYMKDCDKLIRVTDEGSIKVTIVYCSRESLFFESYIFIYQIRVVERKKLCIYATPYETVALLFMGKGKGDLDTMIASNDDNFERSTLLLLLLLRE